MKRVWMRAWVAALAAAALLSAVPAARADDAVPTKMTPWVEKNCRNKNIGQSGETRYDALVYAQTALHDGYQWGGGCWNGNGKDNTKIDREHVDANGQPDPLFGEGPDCSGLTFKSWYLRSTWGRDGYIKWDKLQNIHGPYSSYAFHDGGDGLPFTVLPVEADGLTSYATTDYMDAFAHHGHIGLIESEIKSSRNTDEILEAYSDAEGVKEAEEDYRSQTRYRAVRRNGITTTCQQCKLELPIIRVG